MTSEDLSISVWGSCWLFAIGFCDLTFWQSVWAVAIWPLYIGRSLML